jgi:hypothetical protein
MALIFRGMTECGICRGTIEQGDDVVAFSHFLEPEDPLVSYSDAAFHVACFAADPNKQELELAWAECLRINGSRPKDVKTDEERQTWAIAATASLLPFTGSSEVCPSGRAGIA